ncbi:MAG: amidohydrolase family protein [Acidobacteria bacterium]|nr:amidohydrolase family protein [Acidobacteriota bacterium]
MPLYRASWLVPIAGPPIRHGWVATRDGRVVALGGATPPAADEVREERVIDLGDVVLMPALVNAHTHLELSWLRGRVRPAGNFIVWVGKMMAVRRHAPEAHDESYHRDAMASALAEMRASGTGLAGDVSNSLVGLDLLEASGLSGVVFHEVIGFSANDPKGLAAAARQRIDGLRAGANWRIVLAPHAPYSVSPELFEALRDARGPRRQDVTTVHVAESPEEVELVATGGGRWKHVLQLIGAWNPAWRAPRCRPVEYLDRLLFWDARTLAVHGVQATREELDLLRSRGATLVTCPRSNAFVGVGDPPISSFYASGVSVAVGTDSLASVDDLNLFQELAAMHRLAPEIPPSRLLESATAVGARALGLGGEFGILTPGARAAIIAVSVPAGTPDVEQYLVSGITPERVRWVESGSLC